MWRKQVATLVVATLAWGTAAVSAPSAGGAIPRSAGAPATSTRAATVPVSHWRVDPPAAHGMDAAVLDQARQYAFVPSRYTQGVVVARHGAIVSEWYAEGSDASSFATSWSVGKSVTSALIGIAIDDGLIPGVDVPMTTYFPEWSGTERESMTLRDVLTMTSGLKWSESYSPQDFASSDVIQLVAGQRDQLAYAASRPQEVPPGTRFQYSSGDTMLLSGVLEQATGMSSSEYARQELFDPLQIDDAEVWTDAEGHGLTYCCVDTSTRGFARFGQLFLQGGRWGDQQIVSADWVAESTGPSPASAGYGYQWWRGPVAGVPGTVIQARGHDGQYIYIVPELDLVVARNGRYFKSDALPIADPNLVGYLPPQNLVPGSGTTGPSSWNAAAFLGPIVASITEAPAGSITAHFSAAQCEALDRIAAVAGTTRAELAQLGVAVLAAVVEQAEAPVWPAEWVDDGPCEVVVEWSPEDLSGLQDTAAVLGVSMEELHHGGGRLLLAIVWALSRSA